MNDQPRPGETLDEWFGRLPVWGQFIAHVRRRIRREFGNRKGNAKGNRTRSAVGADQKRTGRAVASSKRA